MGCYALAYSRSFVGSKNHMRDRATNIEYLERRQARPSRAKVVAIPHAGITVHELGLTLPVSVLLVLILIVLLLGG